MSDTPDPRIDALAARVAQLEAEVAVLRQAAGPAAPDPRPTPQPPPPSPDALVFATAADPPPQGPQPTAPRPGVEIESETVLKWVGVALVVLAVGFAVSTAISRGWIGPELQLAGAVALSVGLIAAGLRLRTTRMPWSHALCSGGVAALLTTFASNLFVDQTNTDIAFTAVAGVAVAGFALSRFVPSEWVGIVSLLGSLIAWFVIGDGEPPFAATLGLAAAVVVVAVALSLDREWQGLRLLGHLTALVMVLGLAADADGTARTVFLVVAVVVTFLSLARIPSIGPADNPWRQIEVQVAMVGAPWSVMALAETLDVDDRVDVGLIAVGVAAASVALALALQPRLEGGHLISLAVGASLAITIALAALLETDAVFVALAVQGVGLLALGRQFGSSVRLPLNAALLLFVAAVFALVGGVAAWSDDASIGTDLAHLGVIVVVAYAAWQTGHELVRRWGAAVVLGLLLVWLGSVFVHLPEGQAVVSVSWAIVGTGLLVAGALRKVPDLGAAGLVVLALTVGKLLLVDMVEVDTLWRAGLFLVVGLGLMRLGFLLPRLTGAESTASDREG